jgi:aldose 1-epimerase
MKQIQKIDLKQYAGYAEKDFKSAEVYVFENNSDFRFRITNYGARIMSLETADQSGILQNIVLGFGDIESYLTSSQKYYGATIGRYANRISNARFSIDGVVYNLDPNNEGNSLHGGNGGFHNVVWEVVRVNNRSVTMQYLSKDGEEGFPGNMKVTVTYQVEQGNRLAIIYQAETDRKTFINLTNHAFFNLNGVGSGMILDHDITIAADRYLPIDEKSIPSGFYEHVALSPFDFKKQRKIGEFIKSDHPQLKHGKGYDHCFFLNKGCSKEPELAASASGDQSGILMTVYTTEPGIQLYTGNYMTGDNLLQGGYADDFRTGFCLETQHFPNSPNEPVFPSTMLEPNKLFESKTIYEFSVKK